MLEVALLQPAGADHNEAKSHLDTISEQAVRGGLDTLMAKRTTIVITHQLSTIRAADLILAELCDRLTDTCVSKSVRSRDSGFGWAGSSAPEHTLDKRKVGRFKSSPAHHAIPLSRPSVVEVGLEIEMQCRVPVQTATCSSVIEPKPVRLHSRIFPT